MEPIINQIETIDWGANSPSESNSLLSWLNELHPGEVMMRYMVALLALLFACTMSSIAQTNPALDNANPAEVGPQTQISGCLQGTTDQYRLVESDGTTHLLIGDSNALADHVGRKVTLEGYSDFERDASASSDSGMFSGQRFFAVNDITQTDGSCQSR